MPLRGITEGVPFALPTGLLLCGIGLAAVQGICLRRTGSYPWALALCAVPLAFTFLADEVPATAGLQAAIETIGVAGTTHLWALLTVSALVAATAGGLAARCLAEWRASTPPAPLRAGRGAVAAVVAGAFVALVLCTSTGVDLLSSWARWGAIGAAMVASVLVALVPAAPASEGEGDPEPTVHALLVACIGLGLLAQREYVAALAAETLARGNPFFDPEPYEHSLREIARAVEPRERVGWLLALLPSLVLGGWLRSPRLAAAPLVLALTLLGAGHGLSRELDRRAAQQGRAARAVGSADAAPLIEWSARAIPRSVPWLRAMEPAEPELRCAAWVPDP